MAIGMVAKVNRPFSTLDSCQYAVFGGLIGPNITPEIIQNISKTWDEVFDNRIFALVHELFVVWPNHCHKSPRKLGPPNP